MKTTTKDLHHRYWRGDDGKLLLVCPPGAMWDLVTSSPNVPPQGPPYQPTWRDNIR